MHPASADAGEPPASRDGPRQPRRVLVEAPVAFAALLGADDEDGQWLEGVEGAPLPTLRPGERLRLLTTEPNDATYAVAGRVVEVVAAPDAGAGDPSGAGAPARIRVELDPERERIQQRDQVRVATPETPLHLSGVNGDMAGDILNLSAGGIRAMIDRPLEVGQQATCRFELSTVAGTLAVELEGEVVWAAPGREGRALVGVRFLDVDDALQAQIAAWVLRQQARGHL